MPTRNKSSKDKSSTMESLLTPEAVSLSACCCMLMLVSQESSLSLSAASE